MLALSMFSLVVYIKPKVQGEHLPMYVFFTSFNYVSATLLCRCTEQLDVLLLLQVFPRDVESGQVIDGVCELDLAELVDEVMHVYIPKTG